MVAVFGSKREYSNRVKATVSGHARAQLASPMPRPAR